MVEKPVYLVSAGVECVVGGIEVSDAGDYVICDDRGYLVDVLQPIIDARDEIKAAIRREQN